MEKRAQRQETMKRWFFFLLIICIGLTIYIGLTGTECMTISTKAAAEGSVTAGGSVTAEEKEDVSLKLYAQSAVLMDGDTGRVLYGKGQDILRPMASTTKIMTCILALELGNMEDLVTASDQAASQPRVHLGVRSGEMYRLEDLLYALMLESYNDAAVMIAEHIGGSAEGFAGLMNEKARSLGCEETYFITANGLDGRETDEEGRERIHGTTARELARIMMYCIRESPMREAFLKITGTQNWSFGDSQGKRSFQCVNHNALLSSMEGVISGKTGFTGGAGYSYVGAMEHEGGIYIIALLGCGWPPHKTWKWSDARVLFRHGMEAYELQDVFRHQEPTPVPVEGGVWWKGEQKVEAVLKLEEASMHLPVLLKEGEEVRIRRSLPSIIKAPVEEGQILGKVEYRLEDQVIKTYPLYADRTVEQLTLKDIWYHIWEMYAVMERISS